MRWAQKTFARPALFEHGRFLKRKRQGRSFDLPKKEKRAEAAEALMATTSGSLTKEVEPFGDDEIVTYRRKERGRKIVGSIFRKVAKA
jgi:hypothetical protein